MIEKYHVPILALVTQHGAQGVNQIAAATGIPVSTVQKYLSTQQKFFRKTVDRKWDLPERVAEDVSETAMLSAIGVLESTISLFETQLTEIKNSAGSLSIPLGALKRLALNRPTLPVADVEPMNPDLAEFDNRMKQIMGLVQDSIKKVPEHYRDLLLNIDWYKMAIQLGMVYLRGLLSPLSEMLLGERDELTDEIVEVLSKYQIGNDEKSE